MDMMYRPVANLYVFVFVFIAHPQGDLASDASNETLVISATTNQSPLNWQQAVPPMQMETRVRYKPSAFAYMNSFYKTYCTGWCSHAHLNFFSGCVARKTPQRDQQQKQQQIQIQNQQIQQQQQQSMQTNNINGLPMYGFNNQLAALPVTPLTFASEHMGNEFTVIRFVSSPDVFRRRMEPAL